MKLIRRLCACGCEGITGPGKKYIYGHNKSTQGIIFSKEIRKNMSLAKLGNTNALGHKCTKEAKRKMSLARKEYKPSEETKIKTSLSMLKPHPEDDYCEEWRDGEYKKDLIKDYCENLECKENYNKLNNHHIDLNKKNCKPSNIMTLCAGCHTSLHNQLRQVKNKRDILVINRMHYIRYIHKETRQVIATIYIKEESYNVL